MYVTGLTTQQTVLLFAETQAVFGCLCNGPGTQAFEGKASSNSSPQPLWSSSVAQTFGGWGECGILS